MTSDAADRYERWKRSLHWAIFGVLWVGVTYFTPDVFFLTYQSAFPESHLVTVALLGAMGYLVTWFSQWRKTPEALGPDELESLEVNE